MSTHNICFHGEIRKLTTFWLLKALTWGNTQVDRFHTFSVWSGLLLFMYSLFLLACMQQTFKTHTRLCRKCRLLRLRFQLYKLYQSQEHLNQHSLVLKLCQIHVISIYHSPGKVSTQQIDYSWFFFFFIENKVWHFMQIVYSPYFLTNKTRILCHLLNFFSQHA